MASGLRSGAREGFQDGFVYKILSMKDKKGAQSGSDSDESGTSCLSFFTRRREVSVHPSTSQHRKSDKCQVMGLESTSTAAGTRVITLKKYTGEANQKFTALRQESGGFQVSSVHQSGDPNFTKQGWDFLPDDGLLIQNDVGNGVNQVWIAEEIIPNSKICIIKSKEDGRCLKNMGKNNQIMLVPVDKRDKATHWRLEPTY